MAQVYNYKVTEFDLVIVSFVLLLGALAISVGYHLKYTPLPMDNLGTIVGTILVALSIICMMVFCAIDVKKIKKRKSKQ